MKYGRYVLQGCSYFLTPQFFKYYNQLYPETFLYWEEINLLYYLYIVGLHSVLTETPAVLHKEAGSTSTMCNDKKREKMKLKLSWESYQKSKKIFSMPYERIIEKYN